MTCSYLSILLILWLFVASLQAQTFKVVKRSDDPTYVTLGEILVLNVTYEYSGGGGVGLQWRNNSGKLVIERFRNGGSDDIFDSRASIVGKATLVLTNSILSDKGTYFIRVDPRDSATKTETFEVIIQVSSKAKISCTGKGDNFSCLCEGIGGTPPARISWFKNGEKIKGPEYLQAKLVKADFVKAGEGVYYCNSTSGQLNNVAEITLSKVSREDISITIDPLPPIVGNTVKITCSSTVNPPPDFILYGNETMITSIDGVGMDKVKEKSNINYTCKARNIFATAAKSDVVKVEDEPMTTPSTKSTIMNTSPKSETSNTTEKSKCTDCTGFGWYIILVTLVCGIVIGMIFLYGIMSLRRRFKSQKDVSEPAHNYDTPETHPEGVADNSAYQELELKNREPENSYQALRMNTRRRIDNETKIEDEAGYQELDKVREKDNNYQSLNRV